VVAPATANTFFGDLAQKHYIDGNRTGVSTTHFSLGWPGEDLSGHPLVKQADIIHLHWVSGLVSPRSFAALARLGKPLVWTLHDQRPFTGGCHYSAGCSQFESDCAACPQLALDPCGLTAANLGDQLQAVVAHVTVIAPSHWMAGCARRSAVFARSRIEVIPYGIDIEEFCPIPQDEARARLVLPRGDFLLLFGVDNSREKRKGLRELFTVLKSFGEEDHSSLLASQQKTGFLCFGEIDCIPELPVPVRPFGRVQSDELLSCIYSAADLFLLPSLEDNLPNTVLEAMSCGTPVGAFSVGGVPDMIVSDRTGFLAPSGDLKMFRQIIGNSAQNLKGLRQMRPQCRRHVETHFTYAQHAAACLALYEDLLSRAGRNTPRRENAPASTQDEVTNSQRVLAPLLKFVFDREPDLRLASLGAIAREVSQVEISRFRRQVKRTLKHAVKRRWSYRSLSAALEAHFASLQAQGTGPARIKTLLKRLLRLSRL
jgi:glycosyltransferase involved in cell wall biosynthesis